MIDEKRPYRKRARAEAEEQTRRRITESAVELHGTVGPARTSISAIAERAGVRRSTVYRHFPAEAALFDACSSHWAAANPPPDLLAWSTIEDPGDRITVALAELYAYFGRTEQMLENLFRDEDLPLVRERFGALREYFVAAQDALMSGRGLRGAARRRTRAAIGHAIAFSTWKSLAREQGLGDADATKLMSALIAGAR
jgi:AcrR family transcriptional regulator